VNYGLGAFQDRRADEQEDAITKKRLDLSKMSIWVVFVARKMRLIGLPEGDIRVS